MLMSYVLNSTATRHGMDKLASYYLDYETIKYGDVAGTASKQISFSEVEIDVATNYAAEDADITLRLYNKLEVGHADVCWVLRNPELSFGLEDDVGRRAGSIPI